MDIRNAMKPKVTSRNIGKGTVASDFVTGEDFKPVVTEPTTSSITQTQQGTITETPIDLPKADDVVQAYREFLHDRGIDDTTLMSVLDMLITGQTVFWQFNLLGKIPVVFRVRPQWVDKYLMEEIDRLRPTNMARFTDLIGTINLAGSLESYNNRKFKADTVEELNKVIEFLRTLPFIIQNKLVDELAVFDRVVVVATSDWAVKNFIEPR